MERNELLMQIANSINAVLKINALQNSLNRDSNDSSAGPGNVHILCEMLNTIAAYSPGRYKSDISNSVELSNYYINSYKNLRNHLQSARSRKLNPGEIMKTLEMVKPILPNRHKSTIGKIQRVYEIINSQF